MANVFHKIYPFEYMESVHSPNYDSSEWLIGELLSDYLAFKAMHAICVASKNDPFYWVYVPEQNVIRAMTVAEMDAYDLINPTFLNAKKKEYKLAAKQKAAEKLEEEYSDTVRDSLLFEEATRIRTGQTVKAKFTTAVTFITNNNTWLNDLISQIKACTTWNQLSKISI